mgnify:CR=1 FL=1
MEAGNRKILMYRPAEAWLVIGVGALLLTLAAYFVFQLGKQQAGAELQQLQHQRGLLDQRVEQQQGELMALREQHAVLQRASEIDRQASLELRDDFARAQGEVLGLRKELDFYRGIVSPADGNSGLRVQDFKLTRGASEREFNLRLVLVQAMKHDRKVSGNVALTIEGSEDGEAKSYALADLLPDDFDTVESAHLGYLPRGEVLAIATGSQGEPGAALARHGRGGGAGAYRV